MTKKIIYPLTSLRFFAALAILFFHMDYLNGVNDFTRWIYTNLAMRGAYPVTFFFVLSGFILTYNYFNKFKSLDRYNLKKFYVGRLARIYPLHFLTFLIAIPLNIELILHTPLKSLFLAFTNLFLLQGYFSSIDILFSFNSSSWTLSIEFLFYLLFPFISFWIYTFASKKSTKTILLYSLLLWLINILLVYKFKDSSLSLLILVTLPFTRLIDFILGSLLALIFISHETKTIKFNRTTFTIVELFSILSLPIILTIKPSLQNISYYSPYHSLSICFILYIFAFEKGFISKMLSNKILVFLGTISFNIYLFHQLVLIYVLNLIDYKTHPYIILLLIISLTVALGVLSHKFYEIPLTNYIVNKFNRNNTNLKQEVNI